MRPIETAKPVKEEKLQVLYHAKYQKCKPKEGFFYFKIGDRVSISVYRRLVTNGYMHNWSKEIFIVTKIHDKNLLHTQLKILKEKIITGK